MTQTKIAELQEELKNIKSYFIADGRYSLDGLVKWSAKTAAFFETVGVPQNVIDHFLIIFNINYLKEKEISPLERDPRDGAFVYFKKFSEDRLMPLWIAIEYAEIKIKYMQFEESLVPRWLLSTLSNKKGVEHISSALQALDQAFENRSAKDILNHSNSLLESILNLDSRLTTKDLGPKLQTLSEDRDGKIRYKFGGLSCDFFRGINASRLIRNERVVHSNIGMNHNIPFIVGASSAYLVVTLLEATLSAGKLVKLT